MPYILIREKCFSTKNDDVESAVVSPTEPRGPTPSAPVLPSTHIQEGNESIDIDRFDHLNNYESSVIDYELPSYADIETVDC